MNLSSWKEKINEESAQIGTGGDFFIDSDSDIESDDRSKTSKGHEIIRKQNDTSYYEGELYQNNALTIGFVGIYGCL